MADHKGTDNIDHNDVLDGSWCLITEAECEDDTLVDLFEESTNDSVVSNLLDDSESIIQGNSEESDRCIQELKRKLNVTPEKQISELSPRLSAVHITPERASKRRLFNDSGVVEDEAESNTIQVDSLLVQKDAGNQNGAECELNSILRSNNIRATVLCKFKDKFGVSFNELTRSFKSDKTCTPNWVITAIGIREDLRDACKVLLQQHVEFLEMICNDFSVLLLVEFKVTKNRETVLKLMCSMLNAKEEQILCEPPKLKSTAAALYFYKKIITDTCFKYGTLPSWVSRLTIVEHQLASADTFSLSEMVQWAYDNDFTEEASVAYNYACYATENTNAAAFLASNMQVKYVKDCVAMVRMYKRQEMKSMTMSEWISKCCKEETIGEEWKEIVQFLKYQGVNFLEFLIALKQFFKCTPKKMCIVIYGPPDTGKSMFCFKLVQFLKGQVVSYINKSSQFWLMPLQDAKIGLLDDATHNCWIYLDTYLRNAFDGNTFCLDIKHKNLQQTKLPPMIITTNVNVTTDESLFYLRSRLTCFNFPNKLPMSDKDEPLFTISDKSWTCFFRKFWNQLELQEDAARDPGEPEHPFCCTARNSVDFD
ncbi:replication protein E1 [Human papillomavirus type 48]|uniref:Replication protein E1 n=1 Tax=Human papillomavirus type 48 TaxID=40538 RepID=VE1_HPV48|nr:replication protein E1 [Human papillomavirus type 48]Q80922.1 RecName: Full=Replication protein E1; AltName: Full=ATP-dependent helicase E1 [Human papillomavirus type 48]AAA79466.1 replication protein E1 [Human papillomavirus type 48]